MMRRVALCLAFTLATMVPAAAQEDALRAAAERYIQSPVQQSMMNDMLSVDAMVAQMRAMAPLMTEEQLQAAGRIGAEELATLRPDLEAAMIEAAAEIYTLAEIEALVAFQNTPEGASVAAKMQPFMERAMGRVAPQMVAMQGRIAQRLEEVLGAQ